MSKYVLFWGPKNTLPEFSQWHRSDFTVFESRFSNEENPMLRSMIENTYNCAEMYMMARKARLFNDKETYTKIRNTKSPKEQKQLGREVKRFDFDIWNKHCQDIVYEGNLAKFSQNEWLKQKLLDTGDAILVEASPVDKIWGIGLAPDDPRALDEDQWQGQNLLGKALMRVRDSLNENKM